ncbi:MAG: hypothetical protein NTX50_04130 [Candidatus Sumerlaeota bacterium]|nr:hypothetical protein [Candidatus Sumerlaeota bacterium]
MKFICVPISLSFVVALLMNDNEFFCGFANQTGFEAAISESINQMNNDRRQGGGCNPEFRSYFSPKISMPPPGLVPVER